ncbi:Protein of unknown function [Cotesia congregata]|uniref:Uncharacterized protein n=1 Tax=Cotesia congregata TaxID=51543 RepID=A0A8J2HNK8_COTCN|nr:Protein of unknown function [Cotesia congregata]
MTKNLIEGYMKLVNEYWNETIQTDDKEWQVVRPDDVPMQNVNPGKTWENCGVHVIMWGHCIVTSSYCPFEEKDMTTARKGIARLLCDKSWFTSLEPRSSQCLYNKSWFANLEPRPSLYSSDKSWFATPRSRFSQCLCYKSWFASVESRPSQYPINKSWLISLDPRSSQYSTDKMTKAKGPSLGPRLDNHALAGPMITRAWARTGSPQPRPFTSDLDLGQDWAT